MNTKQIVFTDINTAKLLDVTVPPLGKRSVMVQTAVSTVSAGTERANITGDPNINAKGASCVKFPRYSGYSSAGVVIGVGDEVKSVKDGALCNVAPTILKLMGIPQPASMTAEPLI